MSDLAKPNFAPISFLFFAYYVCGTALPLADNVILAVLLSSSLQHNEHFDIFWLQPKPMLGSRQV